MASPHPLSAATLFSLKDWVAVVTGGGTGLGLMIAQTLAANGAKVYITGRRADVLENSARIHGTPEKLGPLGGSLVPIVMDVTSKDSIKSVVAEIGQKEQYINILVNNAGIFGSRPTLRPEAGPEAFGEAMFAESNEDNWQKSSRKTPSPFMQAEVSKAAVSHLTRQMAFELSHENVKVRVNAIALGYFPSEMTTGTSNEHNESVHLAKKWEDNMPGLTSQSVKRMGTPEEVASIVLALAVNDFIWGTVILVDGGLALNVAGNM
ncbi:hypothetical protein AAE478_010178 [Parahypoxylon ruwenzoriense]